MKKDIRKLRVFHLITHFDLGGAEHVAANIAESASPDMEYHVVEILRGHSAFTQKFTAELKKAGVRCHRSLMPDFRFHFLPERFAAVLFPLRFLWLLLRWRPDVIHTHTETPDIAVFAAKKLLPWTKGFAVVRTIHNTQLWTGLPRTAILVEQMFGQCHANIAISNSVRDSYAQRFGEIPPIIHNGVAEVEQKPFPDIEKGKTNILFAGRLEAQKGIDVLLATITSLRGDTNYHFHIIGTGSMKSKVQTTVGNYPNVTLYDAVYGLSAYLSSFDYLFMPSEFEGLSMLSMEASLNGLPVIANDCPGLSDTLPPYWQLKVHGNDLQAYLHIFKEILPHANRQQLIEQARQYALSNFTVSLMQTRYEDVYRAKTSLKTISNTSK